MKIKTECQICGQELAVYTCRICGRRVCEKHYDKIANACVVCSKGRAV